MKPSQEDFEEEDATRARPAGPQRFEFDCPSCNANNPWPDGFRSKDEVICHFCGLTFLVEVSEGGRLRLKEL